MEGISTKDSFPEQQLFPGEDKKRTEQKQVMAMIISFMVIVVSLLLSFERDPITGAVSINPMIIFWGIILGVMIFFGLTLHRRPGGLVKLRFCVNCGRNIPFEAVICPYCRYDYEIIQDNEIRK